jgi:phosphodiester glycosidase
VLCPGAASARAATLPATLAPAAPFPLVAAASVEREPVAPGVARATYRLLTSAGPLVVSVVTVDPAEPTVRLGTVLAHDSIVSKDEPVSSMARRTGAVAGINGDYFDINATGAPLGILVRDGKLDRSPSSRIALTVTRQRGVRFETYRFAGTATTGDVSVPITGLNVWPPQGGAALLTPAFGAVPAGPDGITLLDLQPFRDDPGGGQRVRVAAVTSGPPWPAAGLRLAYGPAAQALGRVPDVGDVIALSSALDPPLTGVSAVLGGGPELLRNGTPVDDPASPNYAERDRRIPASAAARFADGTLVLVTVDGRHPATSIGVNRAELIALLRALGAVDAMLFDSGGSATLVARVLGDVDVSVLNEPSDGVERPVADGFFVYSDAALGPPSRLVVRPARIVALPGARVALRARVVDANDHGLGEARGPWHIASSPLVAALGDDDVLVAGGRTGAAGLRVARGGVATELPIEVIDRAARIVLGPARANPQPHATVALRADAFDAHDRPLAIDGLVRWSAKDATIDARGHLTVGDRDALVTVSVAGANATLAIPVGRHNVALAPFDDNHRAGWKLVTAPAGGPGAVTLEGGRLRIDYDFTSGERAAYAVNEIALGAALDLSCAIDGDAGGAAVRATFVDRYGDRATATLVRTVDFSVTRRVSVTVPASLAPPVALRNLYVLGTLANPPVTAAGSITVHDCSAHVAGAAPNAAAASQ